MKRFVVGGIAVLVCLAFQSVVFGQAVSIGGPSEGDSSLFFFDNGSSIGQSLIWDDSEQRFRFSSQLQIDGAVLRLGILGGDLVWDAVDDRFETDEAFAIDGAIHVGFTVDATPVPYSSFGTGTPDSGDLTSPDDLFVRGDFELGNGQLYLDRELYMEASPSGENDGDQEIFFYDNNSREGQMLRWDESEDYFEFSDDLAISSDILTGSSFDLLSDGSVVNWVTDADDSSSTGRFEWYSDSGGASDILMELDQNDGGDLAIGGQLTQNASFIVAVGFATHEDLKPGEVVRIAAGSSDEVERHEGAYDPLVVGVVSTNPSVALGGGAFGVDDLREIWGESRAEAFESQAPALKEEVLEADAELRFLHQELQEAVAGQLSSQNLEAAQELERTLDRMTMRRFFARNFAMVTVAGRAPVAVDASFGAIAKGDYLTASPVPGVGMKATKAGPVIGFALEDLESGQGQIVAMIDRGWFGGAAVAAVGAGEVVAVDMAGATEVASLEASSVVPEVEELPAHSSTELEQKHEKILQVACRGSAACQPVSEAVEPGDLLVVDRSFAGFLKPCSLASDTAVVGFASEGSGYVFRDLPERLAEFAPDLVQALSTAREESDGVEAARIELELQQLFESLYTPVATSGIVMAKVDATYGSIEVGDLLAASPTRGYAMKTTDASPGTIVAKALEGIAEGAGRIQVLVMHR